MTTLHSSSQVLLLGELSTSPYNSTGKGHLRVCSWVFTLCVFLFADLNLFPLAAIYNYGYKYNRELFQEITQPEGIMGCHQRKKVLWGVTGKDSETHTGRVQALMVRLIKVKVHSWRERARADSKSSCTDPWGCAPFILRCIMELNTNKIQHKK